MVIDAFVHGGLLVILLIVLIGPFRVRVIEHNLEVSLFICGVAALTLAGYTTIQGEVTGWSLKIVEEALTAPLRITDIAGIPVGIVQIVLIIGLIIHFWHAPIHRVIGEISRLLPLHALIFLIIVGLGFLSSVISAIIAAIILIEVICALPISRDAQIKITVISCFSIGLGAALTPLGEPLSTIVISKLAGPPYYASFNFLLAMLGLYLLPGILAFGILGAMVQQRINNNGAVVACEVYQETLQEVVIRAVRIFCFIMALIFLGEGFKPIILTYIIHIPSEALYWVNSVSAVLDNATLTAAIISPALTELQIRSSLLALLVSGGMLIPGNIPNIIAAGKLRITSKEWAKIGVPVGIVAMAIYFAILFAPRVFVLI